MVASEEEVVTIYICIALANTKISEKLWFRQIF